MTVSHIGDTQGTDDSTATASATTAAVANTQAGDLALLFLKHEGAATTYTASDSASNSWTGTQLATVDSTQTNSNGDLHCVMFAKVLTNGAASHTFTVTAAANRGFKTAIVCVFRTTLSGWTAVGSSPVSNQGVVAAGTATIGSLSPAGNYVAFGGWGFYFGPDAASAGTGWTISEGGSALPYFGEQRLSNSGGATITADNSLTNPGNGEWVGILVAYTEGAASTALHEQEWLPQEPRSTPLIISVW